MGKGGGGGGERASRQFVFFKSWNYFKARADIITSPTFVLFSVKIFFLAEIS